MAKRFVNEPAKSGTVGSKNKAVVKECSADLGGNPAIFGLGVAFLGMQITDLESRCVAIQDRFDQECYLVRPKRKNEAGAESTTRRI